MQIAGSIMHWTLSARFPLRSVNMCSIEGAQWEFLNWTNVMAKKKASASRPKPVSSGGIRYELTRHAKTRGLGQNSGVISAVDEKTGAELWTLKVYSVNYDGDKEDDKQEIDITGLALIKSRNCLRVTN